MHFLLGGPVMMQWWAELSVTVHFWGLLPVKEAAVSVCVVTFFFSDSALTRVPLANQTLPGWTGTRTAFDLLRCLQVLCDTSHPKPPLSGFY